jgi:hypothetical protein
MRDQQRAHITKIWLVIGAKVKRCPLLSSRSQRGQELGLHDPVLVVASLRPGIGKQNVDRGESSALRHHDEEIVGVAANKVKIPQARTVALAIRPRDSVGGDVHADAGFIRVGCRISGKKMPMAAPDLPNDAVGGFDEVI